MTDITHLIGDGVPTPLVGPGNMPNPPIMIMGGRMDLPDPAVIPDAVPDQMLTPSTAGWPAAMRGQVNPMCIPNGGDFGGG